MFKQVQLVRQQQNQQQQQRNQRVQLQVVRQARLQPVQLQHQLQQQLQPRQQHPQRARHQQLQPRMSNRFHRHTSFTRNFSTNLQTVLRNSPHLTVIICMNDTDFIHFRTTVTTRKSPPSNFDEKKGKKSKREMFDLEAGVHWLLILGLSLLTLLMAVCCSLCSLYYFYWY